MNQKIIDYYIDNMSIQDARRIARSYGGDFTLAEASVIVPFIKSHKKYLKKENKEYLLAEIKKVVSPTTYDKIVVMTNRFLK